MGFSKQESFLKIGSLEFKLWQLIALFVILIVCVVTAIWFFNNFERVEKTTYQMTERANYNPYYAAELLIEQQFEEQEQEQNQAHSQAQNDDGTVQDEQSANTPYVETLLDSNIKSLLDDLPVIETQTDETQSDDSNSDKDNDKLEHRPVLIINSMSAKLSDERFSALQQWIEQGGHLITFTGNRIASDEFAEVLEEVETGKTTDSENSENNRSNNELNSKRDSANNTHIDTAIEKLTELSEGNQFLAKLGIVAINNIDTCDDCDSDDHSNDQGDDQGAEDDLVVEIGTNEPSSAESTNNTNNEPSDTDSDKALKAPNHFGIAVVPYPQTNSFSAPLLIKKQYTDEQINTDLFALKHPESVQSPMANVNTKYTQPDYQAKLIRHYLNNRLTNLNHMMANENSDRDSDRDRDNDNNNDKNSGNDNKNDQLKTAIKKLLSLSDEALLQQFVSAQDVYVDVPLGKGRISVLLDRETFTNPNPNFDIEGASEPDSWVAKVNDPSANQTSPSDFLTNSFEDFFGNNLAYVDNAKLLTALTANAGSVWILPYTDVESLPAMLWHKAKFAVLGLGLLVLIWLCSLYDRFGKAKTLANTQAHDILRYFRQVGRYGWQKDHANTLLRLSRQQARIKLYANLSKIMGEKMHHFADGKLDKHFAIKFDAINVENTHKQNPNANPLARLSQKDLQRLSASLVEYKQQKIKLEQSNKQSLNPLLVNQTSLLFSSNLLSADHLHQALIQPLAPSYSTHEFLEITQILWLLNWVLK